MRSFFQIFLASLLAMLVFSVIVFFLLLGLISVVASGDKVRTGAKAVLVVDLNLPYPEITIENPFARFGGEDQYDLPALYDVIRMIRHAREDSAVKGIYIKCGDNNNGLAASEEIRNAILDFKTSKKFVYAYANVISQRAYHVASVADKIYCNPQGGVDWRGFALRLAFLKGTLEKLEIEPQIFYAGKFKSATEPLRESKMTEPNRLQNTVLLNNIYDHFLLQIAEARKIDTATLRRCADQNLLQFARGALEYHFVDGLKYDDEVKDEIREKLRIEKTTRINFVPMGKYAEAEMYKHRGKDKIAVIYAQGDIIDGKGERQQIGSDTYRDLIQRARLDKTIKAIVFRVNSGGGSAMASENIWRELTLAQKEKPLVVSFGDVAASGGYYLSCNADSIFAEPNTITGSIGVFAILPNMQKFFNSKLGVTFDGVKTSPDADAFSVTKPLSEMQKKYIQSEVDSIYHVFKSRVAEGRNLSMEYVDSIGQGRIWTGNHALDLHLIDHIGGLQNAIDCAARLAKIKTYRLREYPEPQNIFDVIFGSYKQDAKESAIKNELGEDGMQTYSAIKKVKQFLGIKQARIPFDISVE